LNITQGWSGTKLPSTSSMTINLVGVSARGGGVGMDACVNTQILATGIVGQALPVYSSNGAVSAAPTGTSVPSLCTIIVLTNQTAWTPSGMTAVTSRQQVAGEQAWTMVVPNNDIYQSSASSVPAYLFMSVTIPFSYTGPTGKDIAFTVVVADQQEINNILSNGVFNSGLTGSTAAITSSTTTNIGMNASDITVGTPQYSYGAPVVMGGGGHASSTVPSWLPQKATSLFPGWATYAPIMVLQDFTVVYST